VWWLAALESGEGSAGGDSLRDLSRVKKTLRQLLGDLKKVTQLSHMSSECFVAGLCAGD